MELSALSSAFTLSRGVFTAFLFHINGTRRRRYSYDTEEINSEFKKKKHKKRYNKNWNEKKKWKLDRREPAEYHKKTSDNDDYNNDNKQQQQQK